MPFVNEKLTKEETAVAVENKLFGPLPELLFILRR
jgi:hypothetical protein